MIIYFYMHKTIKTTLLLGGVGIAAFILGMKVQSFLYDDICLDMGGGRNPGNYEICVIKETLSQNDNVNE